MFSYIALVSRLHIFWIHLGYFPFPFLFCRMLTIIPSKSIECYWNFCYQQNKFFVSRFCLCMSLHHLSVCVLYLTLTRYLKKKFMAYEFSDLQWFMIKRFWKNFFGGMLVRYLVRNITAETSSLWRVNLLSRDEIERPLKYTKRYSGQPFSCRCPKSFVFWMCQMLSLYQSIRAPLVWDQFQ